MPISQVLNRDIVRMDRNEVNSSDKGIRTISKSVASVRMPPPPYSQHPPASDSTARKTKSQPTSFLIRAKDFVVRNCLVIMLVNIVEIIVIAAIVTGAIASGKKNDVVEGGDGGGDRHPCDRVCTTGQAPMECRYTMYVELYNSLGKACYDCPSNVTDCYRDHCVAGDGVEKGIIVINRLMPGPPVVVCQGDTVVAELINKLHTETTSMHFHGEHMQGYQYMDGTPHITQCPILPGARFVYKFLAQVPGTHFYHSHTSFQRGDGAFGAYVVRQPKELEHHGDQYDEDLTEHYIMLQEYFHISTREAFVLHHWDTGKNKADNLLINGKGRHSTFAGATPTEVFKVEAGKRYRFRVSSAGFTLCPILVSVDNHTLTMIESDGAPFKPFEVKSFVVHPGERFDFVLSADQTPSTYLLRAAGLFDCANLKAHAVARVHYNGTELQETPPMAEGDYEASANVEGVQLNALNYAPPPTSQTRAPKVDDEENEVDSDLIPITKLSGIHEGCDKEAGSRYCHLSGAALAQEQADKVFYLGYDLYAIDNPHFHHEDYYSFDDVEGGNKLRTPQINNFTLKFPVSPLLSQESDIDSAHFCDSSDFQPPRADCGGEDFCECYHVLRVNLDDIVELVLIDEGFAYDVSHPFHVHGTNFFVVAMERHASNASHIGPSPSPGNSILRDTVIEMDKRGEISRNLEDPPLKDTVSVPDGGFTIVRFHADNPGYWLVHCHMSWHNHLGMGFVIKVGDIAKDVPAVPKGFPTCQDFTG